MRNVSMKNAWSSGKSLFNASYDGSHAFDTSFRIASCLFGSMANS